MAKNSTESKKKRDKKGVKPNLPKPKRTHSHVFYLNDKENEAVEAYIKKYRVKNKANFLRETIIRSIMERFMEDYPTLFEKQVLDNLVVTQNEY